MSCLKDTSVTAGDWNPHSADQKHQSLNSVLLAAGPSCVGWGSEMAQLFISCNKQGIAHYCLKFCQDLSQFCESPPLTNYRNIPVYLYQVLSFVLFVNDYEPVF